MDRFDCQLLMGTFTYVYHFTLIRSVLIVLVHDLLPKEDKLIFTI